MKTKHKQQQDSPSNSKELNQKDLQGNQYSYYKENSNPKQNNLAPVNGNNIDIEMGNTDSIENKPINQDENDKGLNEVQKNQNERNQQNSSPDLDPKILSQNMNHQNIKSAIKQNNKYKQFNSRKSEASISNANSISQSQQSQIDNSYIENDKENNGKKNKYLDQEQQQNQISNINNNSKINNNNDFDLDDEMAKYQYFPRKVLYLSIFLLLVGVATLIIGIFQPYFFILCGICLIPSLYYFYKFTQFKLCKTIEEKKKVLDGVPWKF